MTSQQLVSKVTILTSLPKTTFPSKKDGNDAFTVPGNTERPTNAPLTVRHRPRSPQCPNLCPSAQHVPSRAPPAAAAAAVAPPSGVPGGALGGSSARGEETGSSR